MKSIIFLGLILALGMSCRAEDDEAQCGLKDWIQFNKEIQKPLCDPEKTDDKVMADLFECKSVIAEKIAKLEKLQERADKMYKECGTPNEKDVEVYKKVDLTNEMYKKILVGYCSDNFKTCWTTEIKKMKDNGEFAKFSKEDRPKFSDEERANMKKCMRKSVGLPEE